MKVCTACGAEYGDEVLFCQRDGTPLRPSGATADLVGQVIADRYHIQKKLGEGGMGQVYLAEHVKMGRRCAIKIMTPGLVTDPDAISRFNREAANASRIGHPNVCAIYDFGETPEGLIYLAMEYIEGRSLSALLEEQGTLPLARAASIMTQCADALQVAHDLGIVHRDLKPDNIMVTTARGRDTVKVVDFGIAKAVGADGGSQKVTKTGFVVGTPEYMSPEQLAGDPVDGRSDLYSLALVFYRMLTGGSPFPADSQQETMIKRLTDDPLPLAVARPDVRFPPELQRVMDRALARTPGDRYPTAQELGRDVRALAGSLTGAVDVEAGTQVVRGDELKGTVPATRVDAQAARQKPPAAPPPATGTVPARRGFPVVPAAVAVVLLATVGGVALMRDRIFGKPDSDSTQTNVPGLTQSGNGAGINPANGDSVVPAADTGRQTTPAGGQANLRNPADTGRGTTVPLRDSTLKPKGELPAPDFPALAARLDVYFNDPDFVDADAARLAGKKLGEQIFEITGAPASLRAKAASVAGQAHLKEEDTDSARMWLRRAVNLDPSLDAEKKILNQLEGQ